MADLFMPSDTDARGRINYDIRHERDARLIYYDEVPEGQWSALSEKARHEYRRRAAVARQRVGGN